MKKIMTVDFDETLAMTVTTGWGGTSLKPIARVINFVFDKVRSEGWEAHIVSFRSEKDKQEMIDFVKGWKLPIVSIVCTDRSNKTPFLKKLGSKLHIDDSVEVCTLAFMAGIECLLVDHGQDDTNEMAKLFPKI
jgi:hypothetical protein